MNHVPGETNIAPASDIRVVESAVKALWEKAKRAGETILQLREEKAALRQTTEKLEIEIIELRETLLKKDQTIELLKSRKEVIPSASQTVFANGEREALAARVKELLARIESYL